MAAALVVPSFAAAAPASLPGFNVDIKQTSVSGPSSGGFMAVQFSVAHSSLVKGAGIVAGGPYYWARGNASTATSKCSCTGLNFLSFSFCQVTPGGANVSELIDIIDQNAIEGSIDPTTNLARQKIWLFSGAAARDERPACLLPAFHGRREYPVSERHPGRTCNADDSFGNACDKRGTPFINDCDFDAAGELLKWIYGSELNPKRPGALSGKFIEFDQSEFFSNRRPNQHGMANSGFLYVPASCDKAGSERCILHVAFHGCQQSFVNIQDKFVKHAGYNRWADTNDIIVLYPQTTPKPASNPKACWNWFDFDRNDPNYANKDGIQMAAVKCMVDRIAGVTPAPSSDDTPMPICYTASNAEHVATGRARDWFFLAVANGSNEITGVDTIFSVTTLKQTAPDFYEIGICP